MTSEFVQTGCISPLNSDWCDSCFSPVTMNVCRLANNLMNMIKVFLALKNKKIKTTKEDV